MMIVVQVVAAVVAAAVLLPCVVDVSVKLGTYAYFRGKQLFEEDCGNGDK